MFLNKETTSFKSKMRNFDEYLDSLNRNALLIDINSQLDKIGRIRALVIGDTIIDNYVFVEVKGRTIKDPMLSTRRIYEENYAGGVLAVANSIGDFIEEVKVVTLIGKKEGSSRLEFILSNLKDNVDLKSFGKEGAPTTIKRRYVDYYRNHKMFKVEDIDDTPISEDLTTEVVGYLDKETPKYDLVIVCDFGHGFINENIRRKLEERARFLSINVQTNSANLGFNYFTQYNRADFVSMTEEELRLTLQDRFEEVGELIKKICSVGPYHRILVTQGKRGCIFASDGELTLAPAFTESTKDTIGAGDMAYSASSLFAYSGANKRLIPFIANCAGAIGANIMGHKENLTRKKLIDFIEEMIK